MIFAQKVIKIPEFYDFCPKMPEFHIIIARKKNFFSGIFWGHVARPLPPSPTPMFKLEVVQHLFVQQIHCMACFDVNGQNSPDGATV